jgi:RNA 3'-terminal phosphate cyclase (ATP)
MNSLLTINGSHGEGGGQILRSSLALAMCTGTPFRIEKIRAGRQKPGLMRQHLTAVNAATQICGGTVEGAAIGSTELTFQPGKVKPGDYHFAVGTAGSATLVLQTVLPALLCASENATTSHLTFEGGTHNPFAPPFDFLQKAFLPLVNRMGPRVTATLERPGFYPAGGGRFTATIEPAKKLAGFDLNERGETIRRSATAIVANLSVGIAKRELNVIASKTGWTEDQLHLKEVKDTPGPGNIVLIEFESEHVTEVFTGFGEVNVSAEKVAHKAIDAYREYLTANVPVGECLADQLLLPLALAGSGSFTTMPLTRHSLTHIDLIRQFVELDVQVSEPTEKMRKVVIG